MLKILVFDRVNSISHIHVTDSIDIGNTRTPISMESKKNNHITFQNLSGSVLITYYFKIFELKKKQFLAEISLLVIFIAM